MGKFRNLRRNLHSGLDVESSRVVVFKTEVIKTTLTLTLTGASFLPKLSREIMVSYGFGLSDCDVTSSFLGKEEYVQQMSILGPRSYAWNCYSILFMIISILCGSQATSKSTPLHSSPMQCDSHVDSQPVVHEKQKHEASAVCGQSLGQDSDSDSRDAVSSTCCRLPAACCPLPDSQINVK
ncbi:hypothetical protein ACLKA7_015728 [Drosophila subpalustris]